MKDHNSTQEDPPYADIPLDTKTLIEELKKAYPPQCIYPGQSLEDAHRYAGKVELVEEITAWYKDTMGEHG